MLIISTCFLVLVTGLMAYWLYKTFNHTLSVETAKILETNRDRIFKDNKKIIDIIFGNINKTNKDDYMQFQNNNRYELQILLLDLEYIGILYQNKVLKLDILFNMFAGLFIIIQDDAQIKKYIEERRKVSITKSSKPYDGLLKMINDCVNYDNKNKKIDDI